jgi:hypothetical protein
MWPTGSTATSSRSRPEPTIVRASSWIDPVLVLGQLVYFARDGDQTIRVQTREDGLSIDQIVLSGERYLTKAPGATMNDTTIVER